MSDQDGKQAAWVLPSDRGVAANGIILVTKPDHEDDVEGSGGVLEELGHDGLHAHQGQDHRQQGGSRERDVGVELQHL